MRPAIRSAAPTNVSPRGLATEWEPALRREVVQLEYAAFRRYGYEPG